MIALSTALEHALAQGAADEGLRQLLRGIEKESLRVDAHSSLATTPHPFCLGSPLTHPTITTDFSEAQLELITGVSPSAADTLAQLQATHRFVVHCLDEERLWASSMPGRLPEDSAFPWAAMAAQTLAWPKRSIAAGWGSAMAAPCNLRNPLQHHRAVSWLAEQEEDAEQAYRTRRYFDLIRNFRRHSWLLLTCLAPRRCSKVSSRAGPISWKSAARTRCSCPMPPSAWAAWYQSDAQASLKVSYNGLAPYAETLRER